MIYKKGVIYKYRESTLLILYIFNSNNDHSVIGLDDYPSNFSTVSSEQVLASTGDELITDIFVGYI